jgi:hypothetical protein
MNPPTVKRIVIATATIASAIAVPAITAAPASASCTVVNTLYQDGNSVVGERYNSCTGDLNATLLRNDVEVASGFGGASYDCTGTDYTKWTMATKTRYFYCS